jgi:hypothetical protein
VVLSDQDRALVAYMNRPAPVGAQFGITQYLYNIYTARTDLHDVFPDLDRDGAAFMEWVHVYGRGEMSVIDELLPPAPAEFHTFTPRSDIPQPAPPADWGVNVFGYLQGVLGLGEASRLVISALDAVGISLVPIEGSIRPNTRHEHSFAALPPPAAAFPIDILCSNPTGLDALVLEMGREFFAARYSIAYWWWEVDGPLPFEWRGNQDLLQEMWAASRYIAACLGPQLAIPVHTVKLPVELPAIPALSRQRLGLPEGFLFLFLFLFLFDFASTLQRKNPLGLIGAFRRAFEPGSGATLAIKCVNTHVDKTGMAKLQSAAGGHPDIHIIDRLVSAEEKNAMIA